MYPDLPGRNPQRYPPVWPDPPGTRWHSFENAGCRRQFHQNRRHPPDGSRNKHWVFPWGEAFPPGAAVKAAHDIDPPLRRGKAEPEWFPCPFPSPPRLARHREANPDECGAGRLSPSRRREDRSAIGLASDSGTSVCVQVRREIPVDREQGKSFSAFGWHPAGMGFPFAPSSFGVHPDSPRN